MVQCQSQMVNKVEMTDGTAQQQNFTFNSIQVLSVSDGGQQTQYSTCPAIMTDVVVEDVYTVRFECDTAASHSIISEDVYNGLRKQKWRVPSMMQEKLVVRLADGTVSSKACGSVRLKVRARNSKEVTLDFFVMDGPNNLLGRYALEKLWPNEYNALRQVATVSAAVVQQRQQQQRQQQQRQETPPTRDPCVDRSKTSIYTNEAYNSCDNSPGVGMSENTVYSNEACNSRRFPSVGEPKNGTVAANETHNSSRSAGGADTSIPGTMMTSCRIPSVDRSCGVGSNEACDSSRSAVRADASLSGTMVTSRTEAAAADASMATALPEKRTIPSFPIEEIT